ncbi:hypothetical protein [Paludisphaera mucosa]|uniref:Uncharacterized protein n=1 Tax=Paludisphaera mucosa TaxID=3030827 RepID=A0ABT6FLJ9_9BACT|nr:hypothetical protein [Paludisphaera mucosa]MDG3008457.1 hypothetical protein [Paludisphaera mucosa]
MLHIENRQLLLARLDAFVQQVTEFTSDETSHNTAENSSERLEVDLGAVMRQMLEHAKLDGALVDPARRSFLEATWHRLNRVKLLEASSDHRPRQAVEMLHEKLRRNHLIGVTATNLPPERTAEMLEWALTAIAQAIHGQMPRSLMRTGGGQFRIDWTDSDGTGYWEDEIPSTSFSIRRVAQRCFMSPGGFTPTIADYLSTVFIGALRGGSNSKMRLEGLDQSGATPDGKTTWLRWMAPEVDVFLTDQFEKALAQLHNEQNSRVAQEIEEVADVDESRDDSWLWNVDTDLAFRFEAAFRVALFCDDAHVNMQPSQLDQLSEVVESHVAESKNEDARRLAALMRRREAKAKAGLMRVERSVATRKLADSFIKI